MKWLRSRGSARSAAALTSVEPPRQTAWTVARGERVEVLDAQGELIVWTRADRTLAGFHDASGRLVVMFSPAVGRAFSAENLVETALDGAIGAGVGTTGTASRGGPVSGPALNLRDLPTGVVFAVVVPTGGSRSIELLPQGRLNDRVVRRRLDADFVARLQAGSPLGLTGVPPATEELTSADGRVMARATYEPGPDADAPRTIEVLDNDLPAPWLLGSLWGAHHWHG
jgi:hypothetical protein